MTKTALLATAAVAASAFTLGSVTSRAASSPAAPAIHNTSQTICVTGPNGLAVACITARGQVVLAPRSSTVAQQTQILNPGDIRWLHSEQREERQRPAS